MANGLNYSDIETLEISLGGGMDTFTVDSTMARPDYRTVTLVNTGGGDDDVTVDLHSNTDGFFALNTEAGNDTVSGSTSTLPLVVFGGDDDDVITTGSALDIIFGDKGMVDYLDPIGTLVTRLGISLGERSVIDVPAKQTDGIAYPIAKAKTIDDDIGGVDNIDGGDGLFVFATVGCLY